MHTGTSHGILYIWNYTTILKRIRITAGEKKCPYWGKDYKDLLWWLLGCERRGQMVSSTQRIKYSPPSKFMCSHLGSQKWLKIVFMEVMKLKQGHEVELMFNMTDVFVWRGNLEMRMCLVGKLRKREKTAMYHRKSPNWSAPFHGDSWFLTSRAKSVQSPGSFVTAALGN